MGLPHKKQLLPLPLKTPEFTFTVHINSRQNPAKLPTFGDLVTSGCVCPSGTCLINSRADEVHIVVCWVFHNTEWTERWSEILSPALNSHWLCWGECKMNARWQTRNRTGKLYFTNKMTWVLPETPSHRRASYGIVPSRWQSVLPDHSQELFSREDRDGSLLVCFPSKPATLNKAVSVHVYWNWDMTNPHCVHDWKSSPWINPRIHSCLYQLKAYPLHPGRSVWNTPNAGASPHPPPQHAVLKLDLALCFPRQLHHDDT